MKGKELDKLLVRIAAGDNAAFEELYVRTKRGVYSFLYTYFHNAADTEDAMQSAYLNIKRGIHTYRPGSNASAWILQIAKNLALNEIKKKSREVPTDEIDLGATINEGGRYEITDLMQRVLTEEEQHIVTLHVVWNYKHREIAEMLGVPTGTVTSKYKRSIEKLKNAFKEEP